MVSLEDISSMEEEITERLLEEFDLDLRLLVYDTTNFFTWIDTFNERCAIPKRGYSKAKRADLRQVNLALLVSADHHIPLFHKLYEGNTTDKTSFLSITEELVERYRAMKDHVEDITIVFDKGNNSGDGMKNVDASPYHFVGSLVPSHHKDLLEIPRDEKNYKPINLKGFSSDQWSAHRTTKEVFGKKRTIVVTYNEKLYITQLKTISRELGKAKEKLDCIQRSLSRWRSGKIKKGKKPTLEGTRKKVEDALSAQHMKRLIEVEVSDEKGLPRLRYRVSQKALSHLSETTLGKKILFTDNHKWSTEQIVAAYHAQTKIEEAFKRMKRPHFVSFSPSFHWTDQKPCVHAFCCVLALSLTSLLHREANNAGIEISLEGMMQELSGIMEVAILYPASRKGRDTKSFITLSSMNKTQKRLFELFGLERYRS
ncbi:MAG: IS1634 family transposase [Actinomycetota bacterium]|nr:IS1634 family transposase [Actinomycetota bacterium]